jgi:hypothetical protein
VARRAVSIPKATGHDTGRSGTQSSDVTAQNTQVTEMVLATTHGGSAVASPSNELAQPGSACRLQGTSIYCGAVQYRLLLNKPRRAVASEVFAEANRLELATFNGDLSNERAVRAYLLQAYQKYISKMIELGLAGSTMSFTTFYYSFVDQHRRDVDFTGRFSEMFEFLKEDRQRLAVSTAQPAELPKDFEQCGELSSDIIVCDNQKQNWIYQRAHERTRVATVMPRG